MLSVLPLLLLAAPSDDTAKFLDPANWHGRDDIWTLKDGVVVGETTQDPKYNTFFVSKAEYGDFELRFRCKLRDGVGNSGVQIRSRLLDPKKFVVGGPQVDVGKGFFGSLYGEAVGGYLLKAAGGSPKLADFNDYLVVAKGNHVTVTLNGEVTVDADFPDNKGKNPAPAKGIIAFQAHAGYPAMGVEFTDIKFTDLTGK